MKQIKREFNGIQVRVVNRNGQEFIHLKDLFLAMGFKASDKVWPRYFKHENVTIINGMGCARAAYATSESIRETLKDEKDVLNWLNAEPRKQSQDLSVLLNKLKSFRDECLSALSLAFSDGSYQDEIKDSISEVASTLGVAIGNQKVQDIFG